MTYASSLLQGCPGADGPNPSTSIVLEECGRVPRDSVQLRIEDRSATADIRLQLVCVQLDFGRYLFSKKKLCIIRSHLGGYRCVPVD